MASQRFWKAAWSSGVDNDLSGEAVAEGVQRRRFLAFFGAGVGGELGIVAIGRELGLSHFSKSPRMAWDKRKLALLGDD
jgi:hypothetical protein